MKAYDIFALVLFWAVVLMAFHWDDNFARYVGYLASEVVNGYGLGERP